MIQSLVIILVPLISRIQAVGTIWGTQYDLFFFWKDKTLWLLSFLLLFSVKNNSKLIVFFLGCLFLSTFYSGDLLLSIWGMPHYSEGSITFLCYCVLFLSAGKYKRESFLNAASISVLCVSFLCLLQLIYSNYLLFPPIYYLTGLNEYSPTSAIKLPLYASLGNPNHLGLYCALLFPVFVRTERYLISVLLLILSIGCSSRGAWVAIALTTPLFFWKKIRVPAVIGALFFSPLIYNKLTGVFSSSGRFFIWKNSIKLIPLWIGKGPATFVSYFPQALNSQVWTSGITVDRPHNMYIQIAHATGFLSLIPLSIIVYMVAIKDDFLKWGVFSFLIAVMFTDSMVGVTPIFAILCGLIYFGDAESANKFHSKLAIRFSEAYRKILELSYVKKCRVFLGYVGRKLS